MFLHSFAELQVHNFFFVKEGVQEFRSSTESNTQKYYEFSKCVFELYIQQVKCFKIICNSLSLRFFFSVVLIFSIWPVCNTSHHMSKIYGFDQIYEDVCLWHYCFGLPISKLRFTYRIPTHTHTHISHTFRHTNIHTQSCISSICISYSGPW